MGLVAAPRLELSRQDEKEHNGLHARPKLVVIRRAKGIPNGKFNAPCAAARWWCCCRSCLTLISFNLPQVPRAGIESASVFHVFAFQWKQGTSEAQKDRA